MNKILSMIGLAKRAGKTVSGEFQTEEALKKKKAFLVLVAADASDNTRKKFTDKCKYRSVPIRMLLSKSALGHAIGQEERSCVAVTDEKFASALRTLIDKEIFTEG